MRIGEQKLRENQYDCSMYYKIVWIIMCNSCEL